ncbi:MAG: hypothetical protein FWE37_09300 [Spirochaetaceae bacterium]|nr:hypothetical protein [Spirochaetaceae bacterium]
MVKIFITILCYITVAFFSVASLYFQGIEALEYLLVPLLLGTMYLKLFRKLQLVAVWAVTVVCIAWGFIFGVANSTWLWPFFFVLGIRLKANVMALFAIIGSSFLWFYLREVPFNEIIVIIGSFTFFFIFRLHELDGFALLKEENSDLKDEIKNLKGSLTGQQHAITELEYKIIQLEAAAKVTVQTQIAQRGIIGLTVEQNHYTIEHFVKNKSNKDIVNFHNKTKVYRSEHLSNMLNDMLTFNHLADVYELVPYVRAGLVTIIQKDSRNRLLGDPAQYPYPKYRFTKPKPQEM